MPKLTVVVPVYNVEKYLSRCVDSIINQTVTDFECILVDDGSKDSCPEICDKYAEKDSRIKVIHKKNGGLSDARNAGIDIAQGEYISFIDGDDYIHPDLYKTVLKILQKNDSDIICFRYQFVEADKTPEFEAYDIEKTVNEASTFSSEYFLENFDQYYHAVSWISACTKVYKTKLFENHRYPYGLVDEDSYMLHQIASEAKNISRTEAPFYYYAVVQGSISHSEFSEKNFHKNGANIDRVDFFKRLGIKKQENFFKRLYLINVLKMYYDVKKNHPQFMSDYKKYIKEYKSLLSDYIKDNDLIFPVEKYIFILFKISPALAEVLFNKYMA